MIRELRITIGGCALVALAIGSNACAQLAEFEWNSALTGPQQWQVGGNWTSPMFPGGYPYMIPTFPNDPGRMDESAEELWPVVGANLSGPLGSDLLVDVGATNVTIAALTLGGTAGPVTTEITSSGGLLVFEHGELNPFDDPDVPICAFNCGSTLVLSGGAPGSTNLISAPVRASDNPIQFSSLSTNSIELTGDFTFNGGGSALQSFLRPGLKATVSGNISLVDAVEGVGNFLDLNTAGSNLGVLELSGVINDGGMGGGLNIGPGAGDAIDPLSTVIISGNNSFSGQVNIGRATVVLANDNALGQGSVLMIGAANEFGRTIVSDNDARTIANELVMGEIPTFAGEHSLTWTGRVRLLNTRGVVNTIASGKTLTFTGPIFPNDESDTPPEPGRRLIMDGSGRTIFTGGIHNQIDDPEQGLLRYGQLVKRGSGALVIDFDDANSATDTPTDMAGFVYVEGGNLHFAADRDLPDPGVNEFGVLGEIISSGGAVGVDSGVVNNSTFLGMLSNSDHPNFTPPLDLNFFVEFDGFHAIYNRFDSGGLMLGTDEYDEDLNFDDDQSDLANAANMSLAAHESGSTYTGTITPSTSVVRNPNTYQLGGGSGTLTLPGDNQLTGNRDLLVTNGGEVRLEGTNDYTGTTKIAGKLHQSFENAAPELATTADSQVYFGSTLTVTTLADGDQDSSIGSSASDAENLIVQGSTLKYEGAATSTDRLFTVGTAGATIDASGSGAIHFTNTSPLAIDIAENREGVAAAAVTGFLNNEIFGIPTFTNTNDGPVIFDTSDLVPGMAVSVAADEESGVDPFNLDGSAGPGVGDDLVILDVPATDVILIGEESIDPGPTAEPIDDEIPWSGFGTTYGHIRYDFGPAPARTLTLTGENADDNTLSPRITDAADRDELDARGEPAGGPGGKGSVSVTKSGSGTWILASADNTYTGDTVVVEGVLQAESIGSGDLTVEDGGTIAPGLSVHTLTVGGLYRQTQGATIEVEIAGSGDDEYDVLEILGDPEEPGPEPGDYNEDGVVNAADYAVLRNHFGESATLPNENEEAETPGVVDDEDYEFWRENFGDRNVGQDASAVVEGLIFIDLLDFNPTVGDMFEILTANSLIANNLTLTGESAGFELLVNPTSLVLSFTGETGAAIGTVVPEPTSILLAVFATVGLLGRVRTCSGFRQGLRPPNCQRCDTKRRPPHVTHAVVFWPRRELFCGRRNPNSDTGGQPVRDSRATLRLSMLLALAIVFAMTKTSAAQLTEFSWTGGVDTNWRQDGNWDMAGFPNTGNHTATISAGADLSIDLGANDTTVAELSLEGTTAGAAINLVSTGGGTLILANNDDNTFFTNPDPEVVPWLNEPGVNDGRVLIHSLGPAGSTNEISAPILLNNTGFLEGLDFYGDRAIVLSGGLNIAGAPVVEEPVFGSYDQLRTQVRNFMADQKATISGDIVLNDAIAGGVARSIGLNNFYTTDHGNVDGGPFPDDERFPPRGTIEVSGDISGGGGLSVGWEWAARDEQTEFNADPAPGPNLPLSTVILSGDNSFTGDIYLSQVNLVLRRDHALGNGGKIVPVGDSAGAAKTGFNIVVDEVDVTIANPIEVDNWITFKGSSLLRLEGMIYQTSNKGLINLLAEGETLTLTGPIYVNTESEFTPVEPPPAPGRTLTFDGTGRMVVTGGIHDMLENDPNASVDYIGIVQKRGGGTVIVDFDEVNNGETDSPTDYHGYTFMEGGNLHFATGGDVPVPGVVDGDLAEIVSSAGAIGVDDGVLGNSQFLGLLNNASNPNLVPAVDIPFFRSYQANSRVIYDRFDHGGLMLGSDEYDQDVDFNNGDIANAANMTLAAHATDSTYTGTITPSSSIIRHPNTYQLGGGAGILTLPNSDQLVDDGETPRHLIVRNGGEVMLDNSNSYTGSTKVHGTWNTGLADQAAQVEPGDLVVEDDVTVINPPGDVGNRFYRGTMLTVSSLADGNSSIGTSTAAEDLVVQGSTLKYVGGDVNTNRLFTVGTAGATIDASGNGTLNFTNTGALAIDVAEDREGVATSAVPRNENNEIFGIPTFTNSNDGPVVFDTTDLIPGMTVSVSESEESTADPFNLNGGQGQGVGDDLVILDVLAPDVVAIGEEEIDDGEMPWAGFNITYAHIRYNFGPAPARTLTLAGNNLGDNTLAPQITDAADRDEANGGGGPGGKGSVGVTKTGAGRWLLANANNTYTGDTVIEEGTLAGMSIGSGDLSVENGGTIAPGLSTGTLAVGGDFLQASGATFEVEIDGTTNGTFDVLAVTGDATLEDGAIIDIVLGAAIGTGTTFDILTASSITANIDMLSLTGAAGFEASLTGGGTILQLMFTGATGGLAGDYNDDGIVNAADYVVWRNAVASGGSLINEGDNPGTVDQGDYTYWKTNFGATSGTGSSQGAAVPEPASAVLAVLITVSLTMCVGRREIDC